jgi:hypothetical protein
MLLSRQVMASNVAGPSNLLSAPIVGGMTTMFNHSSGTTSTASNGAETSIYPPQPYANHQSTQPSSGSAHTSPSTSASKTNKSSDSTTDNTSTGSTVSGLSRKRNASSSPGNDAKEKKARADGVEEANSTGSPGQKGQKGTVNGSPTDGRSWGEEAAK